MGSSISVQSPIDILSPTVPKDSIKVLEQYRQSWTPQLNLQQLHQLPHHVSPLHHDTLSVENYIHLFSLLNIQSSTKDVITLCTALQCTIEIPPEQRDNPLAHQYSTSEFIALLATLTPKNGTNFINQVATNFISSTTKSFIQHLLSIDPHLTTKAGDLDQLRLYFKYAKSDTYLNVDTFGNSCLYYACLCGHLEIVDYLFKLYTSIDPAELLRCSTNALNADIQNLLSKKQTLAEIQSQSTLPDTDDDFNLGHFFS